MGGIKELNIKNQTYYYFDDMIDIRNFHSNLLKVDKRPYKDDYIYHIDYCTIKKFGDYGKINNVNPLYLIIYFATGYLKEKNGKKYLIIDSTEEYKKVFSGIKSEIETINDGKEKFYEKNDDGIRFNTDDDLPLNKQLKFPMLTLIITCVFEESSKLYPQIYLDECLYES